MEKATKSIISGDFMPYNGASECDRQGYCQKSTGFVNDIFKVIASNYNFTIRHKYVDSWGTGVSEGNSSADTAMGKVVSATYQMSLTGWYIYPSRKEFIDWSSLYILTSNKFLLKKRPATLDYGFFVRPLDKGVWLAILGMIGLLSIALIGPILALNFYEKTDSSFLTKTSGWYFFLLIYTFYGGALTMFFANDNAPPFSNMIEIIDSYPGGHHIC